MRFRAVVGGVFFLAAVGCGAIPEEAVPVDPAATPSEGQPGEIDLKKLVHASVPVPNQYIVVFDDDAPDVRTLRGAAVDEFVLRFLPEDRVLGVYRTALRGFVGRMSEEEAIQLAQDPNVRFVEEDGVVSIDATQADATWGLDRVDQRDLPLDSAYAYPSDAAGVNAYVIDTGIRRTHADFEGRAFVGFDAIGDGQDSNDCNGHGTHVAGTIGGATWGLAKKANLHAVRVLGCQGSGTNSGVIAGVDWVAENHVKPAVANMSLGGGASSALDAAVDAAVDAGVIFVVAAGNENSNACNGSPSRVPAAVTVGSTTSSDARSSFSNWGSCLDIFAPGTNITSTWANSDSGTATISGTSMASPHVAGAAALYLAADPDASAQEVRDALVADASANKVGNPGSGSPNRLLYTGAIGNGGGGSNQAPSTTITAPASGATVSGDVTVSATAMDPDGSIVRVRFTFADGTTTDDTSAPYSVTWDSTSVSNGMRTITATALDDGGATDTASINVNVSNGGGSGECIDGEFAAVDVPLSIPDANSSGVVSYLPVSGDGTIESLALSLRISHTYRGDLRVTLIAPDGTQVLVHNRSGGSADDLVFSDAAVTGLDGKVAAGTWRLWVQDLAGWDVGTVDSWSLRIAGSCDGGGGGGWSGNAAPNLATVDGGQVCTSLEVSGVGDASGVKLDLTGTHAWRSILRGTLTHGGVTREAFPIGTFPSGAGSFSLSSRPVSGFSGSAAGTWTLCIVDTDGYGDTGTLATWSVHD